MNDRYTRVVLTIIAACLIYLCLAVSNVGTPLGAQQAGTPPPGASRPGLSTGPAEVVVVGWRNAGDEEPMPVTVRNIVTVQPTQDTTTRVVVTGWEDRRTNSVVRLAPDAGLPVTQEPAAAAAPTQARPTRVVLVGTESVPGATWTRRVPVEVQK